MPVEGTLTLETRDNGSFPFNVDGSTLICQGAATIQRVDSISLIARAPDSANG